MANIYCYSLDRGTSVSDSISVDVKVCRPSAGQDVVAPLAHLESITLDLSFADIETVNSLAWDALRAVVDSTHMRCLCISYSRPQDKAFEVTKKILCSVLRRTQLTWALGSGKLQFGGFSSDPATSADILFIPTEHTIDGTTITLDIAEQAEWLLLPVRRPYTGGATRETYLRRLVAARMGGVSTGTDSGSASPTADSAQVTAVVQT